MIKAQRLSCPSFTEFVVWSCRTPVLSVPNGYCMDIPQVVNSGGRLSTPGTNHLFSLYGADNGDHALVLLYRGSELRLWTQVAQVQIPASLLGYVISTN